MFKNAKVGDRVWCFIRGWGTISEIDYNIDYPIYVEFDDGNTDYSFTYEGILNMKHKNPTLFWDEIKFEIPKKPFDLEKELRKLEIKEFQDGKMNCYLIWNNKEDEIAKNYMIHFQDPFLICFSEESVNDFINNIKDKEITKEQFFTAYKNVFGEVK